MPNGDGDGQGRSDLRKLHDCLQGLHFLHRLNVEDLGKLLAVMRKRSYPAGATVFKQGDPGREFFLVGSGELSVWKKKGFTTSKIANLIAEEHFGENSLISDEPRSATIKTETPCELFVLSKQAFDEILMANPEIAAKIKARIAEMKAPRR